MRILAILALSACASPPPATPVAVETAPAAPLVIGTGDVKGPSAPVAEAVEPLPDGPALEGAPVGQHAPGFTAKSVKGKAASPLKGRVTVVHFWATWCGPCTKSMPALQKLHDAHHDAGLDVLAVSVDDEPDGIGTFVDTVGVKYPVVFDEAHRVAEKYAVQQMPSTYVIDRQGVIRFAYGGYHSADDTKLAEDVRGLL